VKEGLPGIWMQVLTASCTASIFSTGFHGVSWAKSKEFETTSGVVKRDGGASLKVRRVREGACSTSSSCCTAVHHALYVLAAALNPPPSRKRFSSAVRSTMTKAFLALCLLALLATGERRRCLPSFAAACLSNGTCRAATFDTL
jgi:hypothetical protein